MTTRKQLVLAITLGAVGLMGGIVALDRAPAAGDEPKAAQTGQRRVAYIAAFNKGDAKAVASFWTEDATYVDQGGREYKGRAAIEKVFAKSFAAQPGATLAIHTTATKHLTPDVVLEDGVTEVTPAGGGASTAARFSAVIVKKDGEWYVESIRDTVPEAPSNVEHLDGLAWLIGDWTGEAVKGESATASYDWAENENFIVSTFATTLDGEPVVGGTQWIGWDAVDKKVRSWSFYSGGGHGQAVWNQEETNGP